MQAGKQRQLWLRGSWQRGSRKAEGQSPRARLGRQSPASLAPFPTSDWANQAPVLIFHPKLGERSSPTFEAGREWRVGSRWKPRAASETNLSSLHSFIPQIITEHPLCIRHGRYGSELSERKSFHSHGI